MPFASADVLDVLEEIDGGIVGVTSRALPDSLNDFIELFLLPSAVAPVRNAAISQTKQLKLLISAGVRAALRVLLN
jgi:hypothetical protein